MKRLWQVADLVRAVTRQMRFGELSRARLQLLRLEWREGTAECEWMIRQPDVWDEGLSPSERERNVSEQALRDAINMRAFIFFELSDVESANFRAFRPSSAREPPELVIGGCVVRETAPFEVDSLAMRAKLYGLQFNLAQGVLSALETRDYPSLGVSQQIHSMA